MAIWNKQENRMNVKIKYTQTPTPHHYAQSVKPLYMTQNITPNNTGPGQPLIEPSGMGWPCREME